MTSTITSNNIILEMGFLNSFFSSFGIIFISEIADKTFILILFFSTKIAKIKLFVISSLTLLVMNSIAVIIGYLVPMILYRNLIDWLSILCFLFFGSFLIYEAHGMKNKTVEEKFIKYKMKHEGDLRRSSKGSNPLVRENELVLKGDLEEKLIDDKTEMKTESAILWAFFISLILAEMGDRSQITVIIISAVYNLYGVLLGSSLSHVVAIILAIYLGEYLSHYLSEKQMTYIGGFIFFIFAIQVILMKYEILNI